MRVLLWLGMIVGLLAILSFGVRVAELSTLPNGDLAALALLGPLGSSMLFTAVCLTGVGVMGYLEELQKHFEAGRADQRKMLDLMVQLVAQNATNVPLPGVPDLEVKAGNAAPALPHAGKSWQQVRPERQEPKL